MHMKNGAKFVSRDNVEVKVVKLAHGGFGWRVRDEQGAPVKIQGFGKIYGVSDSASRESAEYKASLRAISDTLRRSMDVKKPKATSKLRTMSAERRRRAGADLAD